MPTLPGHGDVSKMDEQLNEKLGAINTLAEGPVKEEQITEACALMRLHAAAVCGGLAALADERRAAGNPSKAVRLDHLNAQAASVERGLAELGAV
jgi:hypothetical protein